MTKRTSDGFATIFSGMTVSNFVRTDVLLHLKSASVNLTAASAEHECQEIKMPRGAA